MPPLVDSHCHLTFPAFAGDEGEVIVRARAAGVRTLLTICTRMEEFPAVAALTERHPDTFCSVGVHPHEAGRSPDLTTAWLLERAAHPKVVGIGETGLDYYYQHAAHADQVACFRAHAAAARTSRLPLIVHARDADEDVAAILSEEIGQGTLSGVIHCFTAGPGLARAALDLGFYISFSGIVTFKNAEPLRHIAREVPADRLLVETDAPYLAPVPVRGRRNEPAFVAHTAAFLAALRGVSLNELTAQTSDNFLALFTKATAAPCA